jgi:RNA polymerase sigma-70 factor (ECF subfamily)
MQNIEEIYRQYFKTVYKYLFCLTRNESISEELTQETFYNAIKNIGKFKGECKIWVWLCQIAKHLWYKELKKKRREIFAIEENIVELESNENIEDNIIEKENKEKLYKKIEKLEGKTKEVIKLRIYGELSFKEIGEIIGKTENWCRVTFYRAKEKIKEVEENGKEKRV